jgi:hypothetical protein
LPKNIKKSSNSHSHNPIHAVYTYIIEANADTARKKMENTADLFDIASEDSPVVDGVALDPAVDELVTDGVEEVEGVVPDDDVDALGAAAGAPRVLHWLTGGVWTLHAGGSSIAFVVLMATPSDDAFPLRSTQRH